MHAKSTDAAPYNVTADDDIIRQAIAIIEKRLTEPGEVFGSPGKVKDYLRLQLARRADQHREVFTVLFLDSQHRLITTEDMFTGTLTQASIYPREVVRRALHHNAAAVMLSHNHPSGEATPSRADENLTQSLKSALSLVDVRVLDHFIVTLSSCRSMAEMGLV